MKSSQPGILRDYHVPAWGRVCLLGGVLTLAGCLPIPYLPVAVNKIGEETLQAIQPGLSTRSDVLLLLADPTVRGKEDAYFVYEWTQGHGGLVFIAGGGYSAGPVAAIGSDSCERFAIKFAPDGRVDRARRFSGKAKATGTLLLNNNAELVSSSCGDPDVSAAVDAWLAMEPGRAP